MNQNGMSIDKTKRLSDTCTMLSVQNNVVVDLASQEEVQLEREVVATVLHQVIFDNAGSLTVGRCAQERLNGIDADTLPYAKRSFGDTFRNTLGLKSLKGAVQQQAANDRDYKNSNSKFRLHETSYLSVPADLNEKNEL